jgi:CBS domain-containing protein
MAKLARDVMTRKPARCSPDTTLDVVARLMVQNNCGQIPVVDVSDQIIGVVTDRDIVSRVVAKGRNPLMYTAESCMSFPVVTLPDDTPLEDVISAMEGHQIRRVPVVDDEGCCAGIISQADVVFAEPPKKTAELLCELSRDKGRPPA